MYKKSPLSPCDYTRCQERMILKGWSDENWQVCHNNNKKVPISWDLPQNTLNFPGFAMMKISCKKPILEAHPHMSYQLSAPPPRLITKHCTKDSDNFEKLSPAAELHIFSQIFLFLFLSILIGNSIPTEYYEQKWPLYIFLLCFCGAISLFRSSSHSVKYLIAIRDCCLESRGQRVSINKK